MLRVSLAALVICTTLAGLAVGESLISTRAAPELQATPSSIDAPRREAPGVPSISFIDSPNAICYRPEEGTGACYILWDYISVSATSPAYIISMTVEIDQRIRAYHAGFFQTSMYIPGDIYGNGFRVNCGLPGTSGTATLGKTYNYVIRARETGGLGSTNYGSVACPADTVKIFVPLVEKP